MVYLAMDSTAGNRPLSANTGRSTWVCGQFEVDPLCVAISSRLQDGPLLHDVDGYDSSMVCELTQAGH